MAHTKSAGSTALGRDSASKRLGIKLSDGEYASAGAILVRQRGTAIRAGKHVREGSDNTLFAQFAGKVRFQRKTRFRFDGKRIVTSVVHVIPEQGA